MTNSASTSLQATPPFRSSFSEDIFNYKYRHKGAETWEELAATLVEDVCRDFVPAEIKSAICDIIATMKFIPGGRYLYYAGRPYKAFNNCYLLRAENDTREDWAELSWKAESCLSTGGGIGIDYSVYRPRNSKLNRTGGLASGPVSKMRMINEIGREVMQGGSRRSAIYASINWRHPDVAEFMSAKDWHHMPAGNSGLTLGQIKEQDFNFPCPLDMTNISLNYDNAFLTELLEGDGQLPKTFMENCRQAAHTGEPGLSFNFGSKENETLRNACCEVVSEDDSDVCNLGSVNMSRITSKEELYQVSYLGGIFLLCGTMVADLPYAKVKKVREKNRRLGLGLMGVHEWLISKGYRYEVNDEFREWLSEWKRGSETGAKEFATKLGISTPVAFRAIAPTGTIGIMAGTTTGIEPVFAVAYKRRYLKNGKEWAYQYVIDSAAKQLIDTYGVDPDKIESATDLAKDYERRIKFQADVQDYVDMAISSTINLPAWGTKFNNEDTVPNFAKTLARYSPRLRGFTAYPDGSRGGQPLVSVSYHEAHNQTGVEFMEHDSCKGGVCGI